MKIYNPDNSLLLDIPMDDSSTRFKEIMGDNNLMLKFSLPEFIDIPLGAWCEFKAERYILFSTEQFVKQHSEHFDYTIKMQAYQAYMKFVKFKFFTVERNPGQADKMVGNPKLKFSLTATPEDFIRLLVDNMNFSDTGSGWTVGECIDSEPVTIDFNHDYCYDVLQKVADAFETEWEVDNRTIHIRKVEKRDANGSPIHFALSYGYRNGILAGLQRTQFDNSKVINRLWIQGTDRNISFAKYGNDTLLMPKNNVFEYEGIEYRTDETGSLIEPTNRSGALSEDSLDTSKIYPMREGVASEVIPVDDSKGFYDFKDNSISADLDYSKMVIAGETMTVIFQTGQLAGKEFDAKYTHSERRFALVPITDNGLVYPQGSIIPEAGDKYAVFYISLPQEYIDRAEMEVRNEAVKYLYENSQPKFTYRWNLDGIYAKENWGEIGGYLNCGYFVQFSDPQFLPEPVDIRITSVKEYINKPKSPTIEISNNVTGKSLGSVLNQIPAQEQATDRKDSEVVSFAKRRFRDVQQTLSMLEDSQLHFANSINPITVQTMAMLVGDESLQFRFVDSRDNPQPAGYSITFDTEHKKLHAPAGILQHMTLGIDNISSSHKPEEYLFWDMKAYDSDALTDAEQGYYLYAKVERNGTEGVYLISPASIAMDADADYYHLLVGILNSEYEEDRSFVTMYGFTEILPGRITTDRIVSSNGLNFIDLVQNMLTLTNGLTDNEEQSLIWKNGTLTVTNATINKALNVNGEAYIAGFYFSNQIIKSKMQTGTVDAMVLDGLNGSLQFNNHIERWTETGGTEVKKQYIRIDSSDDAKVTARNETDGDVAYLSSQGVFANRAGTDTLPASTGVSMKAAIVGLGNGSMDKGFWKENVGIVGVYGRAYNRSSNPAPAYGGWFEDLRANGFILGALKVYDTSGTINLSSGSSLVIGCSSQTKNVYLPSDMLEGKTIFLKQWWTGTLRVYPPSGHRLYDDHTENEYIDVPEGWTAICIFVTTAINDTPVNAWLLSKFKF